MFNFDLSQQIEHYLLEHPYSKEYEIILHLKRRAYLPEHALTSSLALFRSHFLVFNALYRLQANTLIHQRYALSISSMEITLTPFNHADSEALSLSNYDPLALFYLDLSHLNTTTESDIEKLLQSFWQHYFNEDQKHHALKTLELSEPIDFKQIKKQYRRLAMRHHPDRGGDANALIEIHQAMQCLQQYYPQSV